MSAFDRITIDPGVMNGQACIKGTRLTVKRVLLILAASSDRQEIRQDYPQLTEEDIKQALEFAVANLDDETQELK